MGLKSIFVKAGKGIWGGIEKGGKVLAFVDDIPMARRVIGMIPMGGPVISAAMKRCGQAEDVFNSGDGNKKKAWVIAQVLKDLKALKVTKPKYVDDLVSVAFLLSKHYGIIVEAEDDEPPTRKPLPPPPMEPEPEKAPEQPTATAPLTGGIIPGGKVQNKKKTAKKGKTGTGEVTPKK